MADNTVLNAGGGGDTIASDDIAGVKFQRVKVCHGADGSASDASAAAPLPVLATGAAAHDAAVSGAPVLLGGYASAAAPTDVSADGDAVRLWADKAGRLQVGTGQALDFDTGGGVQSTPVVGIALPGAGGPVAGGTTTNPIQIADSGGSLTVDGTVTADTELPAAAALADDSANPTAPAVGAFGMAWDGAGWDRVRCTSAGVLGVADLGGSISVDDNAGSLTVDAPVGTPVFVRLSDGAAAISTLPVSAAALPLPAGASTAAKQPALGTAGAASADVITIQGVASMTAVKVDGSGVTQPVSGTVTANLAAGTNNIGDVDVLTVNGVAPAFGTGVRGATVQRVTVATDDVVPVTMATNTPVGTVAHDAADSGAPLKVGAKAETSLSGVTLVADGDRTDLYAGVDGVLIVRKHSNLEDVVQERTTNTDGAATAFASGLAAPGASVRLWITQVTLCNSSAAFCTVDLRDGAAGSVLWTLPVPATGGCVQVFDPPLKLTANTALAFDASAATSTITISANGFKSKV